MGIGRQNGIYYAENIDLSGSSIPAEANGLFTDGDLWIGSTAVNVGGTHINVGSLTSPGGTLTIGFSSPNITIEAAASIPTTFTANSGSAIPVANTLNILGSTSAAGTSPLVTTGGGNTITIVAQRSQAIASTDATKVGLIAANSAHFTVDANGFLSASSTGIATTITGDSGGALSPAANNWSILGRSGSKTSGSGSTLTVNSPPFSQVGSTSTSVLNSGEFVTAAVTRTLPATAGLLDGDLVVYTCTTAGALVVTANTGQIIQIGSSATSSGGTATSTAIGDSLTLRFDATAVDWRAISVQGNWLTA